MADGQGLPRLGASASEGSRTESRKTRLTPPEQYVGSGSRLIPRKAANQDANGSVALTPVVIAILRDPPLAEIGGQTPAGDSAVLQR